jgi:hypothetical protein
LRARAGSDQDWSVNARGGRAGEASSEFTKYIATRRHDAVKKVLDGLKAGKLLIDVIKTIASHAIAAIKKVVKAFFSLGRRFSLCSAIALRSP